MYYILLTFNGGSNVDWEQYNVMLNQVCFLEVLANVSIEINKLKCITLVNYAIKSTSTEL